MVGPGTQFGNLNTYLASYGLHTPGGGCPNVCVGGYMQGGGYGFTSRELSASHHVEPRTLSLLMPNSREVKP